MSDSAPRSKTRNGNISHYFSHSPPASSSSSVVSRTTAQNKKRTKDADSPSSNAASRHARYNPTAAPSPKRAKMSTQQPHPTPEAQPSQSPQPTQPPASTHPTEPLSTSTHPTSAPTPQPPNLTLTHIQTNLFAAPASSILTHACNARGTWGAGIALAFKSHFPRAYATYKAHCEAYTPSSLVGTALLILPPHSAEASAERPVACLFTRERPGFPRNLSAARLEGEIQATLDATGSAFRDLLRQIAEARGRGVALGQIAMPRINAGLFRCPWERTEAVLRACEDGLGEGERADVVVYTPTPR